MEDAAIDIDVDVDVDVVSPEVNFGKTFRDTSKRREGKLSKVEANVGLW